MKHYWFKAKRIVKDIYTNGFDCGRDIEFEDGSVHFVPGAYHVLLQDGTIEVSSRFLEAQN